MNSRNFKLVFNKSRGVMMVVNEMTSSMQKGGRKAAVVAAATVLASLPAAAHISATDDGVVIGNEADTVTLEQGTINGTGLFIHSGSKDGQDVNTKVVREGGLTINATKVNEAYHEWAGVEGWETYGLNIAGTNPVETTSGRASLKGSGKLDVTVVGARPPEGGKAGSNTSGIFLGNGTELNWTGDVSTSVTGRAFMKGVGAQDGANFIIKNGSLDVTVSGEYKENGRYSLEGLSFVEHINGLDSKTVAQVDGDVNVKVTATNGSGVATALRAERTLNGMTADADMSKRDLVEVRLGSLEKASKLSFSAVTHDAVNSEQDTDKFAAGIMAGNATVTLAGSSLAVSAENHGGTGYGKGVNAWGMGIYDFAKVNADVTGAISVKASADSGAATAIGALNDRPFDGHDLRSSSGHVTLKGGSIDISAEAAAHASGIFMQKGAKGEFESEGLLSINARSTQSSATAMHVNGQKNGRISRLRVKAGDVRIAVESSDRAYGINAAGEFALDAGTLQINATSTTARATGMGIFHNDVTIDAVTTVNVMGGKVVNTITDGIRINNPVNTSEGNEQWQPAPSGVVFKKSADISATAETHTVRGVALMAGKTDVTDLGGNQLRDEAAAVTFEGDLKVTALSGVKSTGIIVDNSWDNSSLPHDAGKGAVFTADQNVKVRTEAGTDEARGVLMINGVEGAENTVTLGGKEKAVSISAKSGATGFGILADHVGTLSAFGTVGIKAQGAKAYGVKADGSAHVILGSDNAQVVVESVSNEGEDTAVFAGKDATVEFVGETTLTGTTALKTEGTVTAHKAMTINGLLETTENSVLILANTTFNGDAVVNGTLATAVETTFTIGKSNALVFGQNARGEIGNNLNITGGSVTNNGTLALEGALRLSDTALVNAAGASISTTTLEIKNAVVSNSGSIKTGNIYVREGGTILEDASKFTEVDGGVRFTNTEGEYQFEKGTIGQVGSDLKVTEIELSGDSATAQFDFVGGEYAFNAMKINMTQDRPINMLIYGDTKVTVDRLDLEDGVIKVGNGATLAVSDLVMKDGSLFIGDQGNLSTTTGLIFSNALGANGEGTDVGNVLHSGIDFQAGSTLTFTDGSYNLDYLWSAYEKLNSSETLKKPTIAFTGALVNNQGGTLEEIGVEKLPEDTVLENVDITASATTGNTVSIEKNVGGQSLKVEGTGTVSVADGKNLTLAGSSEGGELISFEGHEGEKTVSASGATGGLTLGSLNEKTDGTLNATVEVTDKATLKTQTGDFRVTSVKAENAAVEVASGSLSVETMEVKGESTIKAGANAEATVGTLTVAADASKKSTLTVTGSLKVEEVKSAADTDTVINVGRDDAKGALTIGSAEASLKGLTFFLDPAWKENTEITDASSLIVNKTDVDGKLIAGQNSYFVIGAESAAALHEQFTNGSLTWGEDAVTAAAYVAKPITVSTGALVVNGALTGESTLPTVADGSVSFAASSALVADVSGITTEGGTLITAQSFSIDKKAKAVVVGLTKDKTFRLTTGEAEGEFFKDVVAGNKMWNIAVDDTGLVSSKLADASNVYGDLMQGGPLANAGMASGSAWADGLLTDATGKASLADIAARFDAAMNTAGAAAVFTTAYDRASELRDAVRSEAGNAEGSRLWAQVTGGRTKLKGISTGAQSLNVETDAYGLVVGGDVALANAVVGAAFTAGTGDSENDAVGVKDDFDFYGLSVYGMTTVGGIDLLVDASMTFVKSDLTMSGAADIDTDTTTAAYSVGVKAQRTWDFGVEFTPFVGMDVYHVRADGYDNGHGASVQDANATTVAFPIGAKVAKAFDASGFKVSPNFTFAVVPTTGDREIDSSVRFAGAESTYNFTFTDDVKVRSNLGVAVEKENFRFGLNAGYDWGNEERSATKLMLNAQYRF